ncbi:leucyl aminopeptidase family protein [Oricola cellulosilytica]|uniref:Leucyl aminopeptidase family protein n=1 Tax=Oricola cellulosilytica TaxID=1429082 RepID=A0A4R0PM06_9HYPH|nr:leucyl aminopeptidase family protein [Oricola cellulosilytica]TCD16429.1 leucyl aminopeptidase family protein [Oricola cellulosilytica]
MLTDVLKPEKTTRKNAKPIWLMRAGAASELETSVQDWVDASAFKAGAGTVLVVPDRKPGGIAGAVLGLGDGDDPFVSGALASKLPAGDWFFDSPSTADIRLASLGFLMGAYRFARYRKFPEERPSLILDGSLDRSELVALAEAVWLARDLVNTPANDLGPDGIEAAARLVAKDRKMSVRVVKGGELQKKNFPLIHAVGQASQSAPRLIDMRWGRRGAPRLTLVGKGVSFDSGGLDIKPASGMRNMKKDMGGAANILALARLVIDARLDVRLRVLIPAVENAISGSAFRPGDIYRSRKGLTVEIGNTDAEGRLVLADAIALADEEKPDMILDMATLTGAARVALGPDVPPFFTTDDAFADSLSAASLIEHDPVWRLPLWAPYLRGLSSGVADLCNVTTDGFAGSVTAALFLQQFVTGAKSWAHFDIFAWNPVAKPHAPVGGEAHAIRAIFAALRQRYGVTRN